MAALPFASTPTLQILLIFAAFPWWSTSPALAAQSQPAPNIIFILADDLGWNDVGFHGSTQVLTPNIDRLAQEGVILENYYTQPLCSPSRSALLTGRYPTHIGMQHYVITCTAPWGLDPKQKVLPQYLKELGYATHLVGKWHQGYFLKKYTPTYRGFDTFYGHYFNTDYWTHTSFGVEQNTYGSDFHENIGSELDISNVNDTVGQYLTDLYTERAVRLIEDHSNSSQPFFLFLAHWATHSALPADPLQSTPDRLALFTDHVDHPQRAKFLGMLKALDDGVGAVMRAITEKGWADNTVVVFTSDNGGAEGGFMGNFASNWPLRGGKNTLWEGGVRVPAVIWSKQLQKTTYRSNHLMHVTDWLPTLVNRADVRKRNTRPFIRRRLTQTSQQPNPLDGFDMWPVLSSGNVKKSPRNEILLQYDQIYGWGAIRVGDWKLMLNESAQLNRNQPNQHLPEGDPNPTTTITCAPPPVSNDPKYLCSGANSTCLFNIKNDPCEQSNLATDRPDVVQRLLRRFAKYQAETVWPRNRPYDSCANPELYGGKWTTWLEYTGGEEYDSQLPTFSSAAEMIASESTWIVGAPCLRDVSVNLNSCLKLAASFGDFVDDETCKTSAETNTTILVWRGLIPDFVEAFARIVNFTYTYHSVPEKSNRDDAGGNIYGSLLPTGRWTGLLGMLQRGEIDFAAAAFSSTPRQIEHFQLVNLFENSDQVYVSKHTALTNSTGSNMFDFSYVLSPFEFVTWLVIVGHGIFVTILLTVLEVLLPRHTRRRLEPVDAHGGEQQLPPTTSQRGCSLIREIFTRFDLMTENVVGLAAMLGASTAQHTTASRILISAWALVCAVLTSIYAAQLASNAMVQLNAQPFDSFASMQTAGYQLLLPGAWAEAHLRELAETMNDPQEAKAIYKVVEDGLWPTSSQEMYESLRTNVFKFNTTHKIRGHKVTTRIRGPFAAYSSLIDLSAFQSVDCDLYAVDMKHKYKSGLQAGMAFPPKRTDTKGLYSKFQRAVTKMRQSGLNNYVLNTKLTEWNQVRLNTSVSVMRSCANAAALTKGKFAVGDEATARAALKSLGHNAAQKTHFMVMTLYTIRSVFILIICGMVVGYIVLVVEIIIRAIS